MSINEKFFKLFADVEEYPYNIVERGVPQNTLFEFVSSTYLNGLINHVEPFWACVLERYETWKDLDLTKWDDIIKGAHLNLGAFGDDVLVLAESKTSYWFFWFDYDVSDCQIGRIHKNIITQHEMRDLLIDWITSHDYINRAPNTESIVDNYYEIPATCFTNRWVSF